MYPRGTTAVCTSVFEVPALLVILQVRSYSGDLGPPVARSARVLRAPGRQPTPGPGSSVGMEWRSDVPECVRLL
ncbi:hypothetical protein NDU88_000843 [Pleurodeles waltl]|uniref:Uncharacterized protein n=1 Tax=Pleurodeles waltl TaxID=8319 RepID=A0AAV7U5I3_PLEWA|nr:hypothetical protein NDU88_000843 [Pleurodeles waltl]